MVDENTTTEGQPNNSRRSTTSMVINGLGKATAMTQKNVGKAIKSSESAYESNALCFLPRFLCKFPKFWPRTFSLIFGVIIPLWLLILVAAGFGLLVAKYEAVEEQTANDEILAARAILDHHRLDVDGLMTLPVYCYERYEQEPNRTTLEDRLNLYLSFSSTDMNTTFTNSTGTNATVANSTNYTYSLDDAITETQSDILTYMKACQHEIVPSVAQYLKSRQEQDPSASSSLSFNWIRCWRDAISDEWGSTDFIFFPSERLINASRPERQAQTYLEEWQRVQQDLYEALLPENATEADKDMVFEQAALEASGGAVCLDNVEGTSWFFFTIMTTVGYGNQAPITDEGRLLIYIGGSFSLILFAAVLGSTGHIILAIFDDFVSRFWLSKFLKFPIVGVLLWGSIWLGWSYLIATDVDMWWNARLPDFEADARDSLWFAFISTSTIGLGDYFLQPELMFASDALKFSVYYLIGFVFLSTFLNKIGEFLSSMMPKRSNSLQARLKATNIILWKHWPCNANAPSNSQGALEAEVSTESHEQQHDRVATLMALLGDDESPQSTPSAEPENDQGEASMSFLLEEEEAILRALLASVEAKQSGMESIPSTQMGDATAVVDDNNVDAGIVTTSLMTGVAPASEDNLAIDDEAEDDPISC